MNTRDGVVLSYKLVIDNVITFTDRVLTVSNLVYALENTGTVTVTVFDETAKYYNQLSGVLGTHATLYLNEVEIFSGKIDVPLVWNDKPCELIITIIPDDGDDIIVGPAAVGDIDIPVEDENVCSNNNLYQRSGGKKTRGVGSIVFGNNEVIMCRDADESKVGNRYQWSVDGVICLGYLETTNKLIATAINLSYPNIPAVRNRPNPETDLIQEKPSVIYANGIHEEIQGKYIRLAIREEFLVHRMCGWHSSSFSEDRMTYSNNFDLNDLTEGIEWDKFEEEIFKKATFKVKEGSHLSSRRETDYFYYTCQISSIDFENMAISLDHNPIDIWGEPILLNRSNCKIVGIYGRYPLTLHGKMYEDYPPEWNASGDIKFYGDSPFGDGKLLSTIPGDVVAARDCDGLCTDDYAYWNEEGVTMFRGNACYAYFKSVTGNNAIDIIRYISSWNVVVQPGLYEMHEDWTMGRYYEEDVRVIDVIRDICKEACIAFRIMGDNLYLTDLTGELDTTPVIYEEDEVEIGTVKVEQTPYKDLKSIFTGKWRDIMRNEDKVTVKGNVPGRDEWEYTYEFYHNEVPIKRSVEYYACVLGNSWELLSFNCFLSHLDVRPVDYIQFRDWDAYVQTLDLAYNTVTPKTRTTRSLTGGVFPPELTDGDGTYDIDVCDGVNDPAKKTDDFASGDDKYVANNLFLPALVPKQGLNKYMDFINQSDKIQGRVINVYNTCLVVEIVNDNAILSHTLHNYFGENFYNARWLVAYPDALNPGKKAAEMLKDHGGTVFWTGGTKNIACWIKDVDSYLVTPDLNVVRTHIEGNSIINLTMNKQGYSIMLDKFYENQVAGFDLENRKRVLTPFMWTGEGYSWAKNDKTYVYDRSGSQVVVEGV